MASERNPIPHSMQSELLSRRILYAPAHEWSPTPLDPYCCAYPDDMAYPPSTRIRNHHRVYQAAEQMGLPSEFMTATVSELDEVLNVRMARNDASFMRLNASLEGKYVDPEMLAIIEKARGGNADMQELLRLIKEHPEMISVECFKRTTPFDHDSYEGSERELRKLIHGLQAGFEDAEIILFDDENQVTTRLFITEHGALVWKQKIGEAKSRDSRIEIIVKHSQMILPPNLQLRGVRQTITGQHDTKVLAAPLSISAYFRTTDYKERAGYESPESEDRRPVAPHILAALGSQAADRHEEVLASIPSEMIEAYTQGATGIVNPEG